MKDGLTKFTALHHHLTLELFKESYRAINPDAVPGADGVWAEDYAERLDENIGELWESVQNGTYTPLPGLRSYIPKQDGTKRPLGIAAVRDKIVQRSLAEVLNQIYEVDFKEFYCGFRPKRNAHN
ncbi:MAG: hypothetical protein LBP95_05970 [Deltaproteobacteria bacterium]|jgi:retron-type reverse transcriptase|nr:hypothetical protein [Deltaproteobacteria bacterium]